MCNYINSSCIPYTTEEVRAGMYKTYIPLYTCVFTTTTVKNKLVVVYVESIVFYTESEHGYISQDSLSFSF